ncbi:MAG TPA: hypothetical protein VFZ84_20135 [Burkholderiales bacterium]
MLEPNVTIPDLDAAGFHRRVATRSNWYARRVRAERTAGGPQPARAQRYGEQTDGVLLGALIGLVFAALALVPAGAHLAGVASRPFWLALVAFFCIAGTQVVFWSVTHPGEPRGGQLEQLARRLERAALAVGILARRERRTEPRGAARARVVAAYRGAAGTGLAAGSLNKPQPPPAVRIARAVVQLFSNPR